MKRKFSSVMIAAAALAMGFSSCNNDDDVIGGGDNNALKGERTSMQFIIKAPKAPQTYAPEDNNATDAEVELKNVYVYIYEKLNNGDFKLEQDPVHLTMSDFDAVANEDAYQLREDKKINTTTGEKRIYVAMNYPVSFAAATPNDDLGEKAESYLIRKVETLAEKNTLSNNGLAMFSNAVTTATLVTEDNTDYATNNYKTIVVKRLVAKITVQEGAGLRNDADKIISEKGELTELQFAVGNINKTSYVLQNVGAVGTDKYVQDNNWESFAATDFYSIAAADYQAVDAKTATVSSGLNPVYVPENTAKEYDVDGKNVTYVSVRAKYAPEFFCDATGTSKGANTTAKTFWTVTRSNGLIYYFDVEADATNFSTANTGSVKSAEYTDGYCYWRGYLNADSTPDATITGSKANIHDVLRNTFYKATITGIKAPGAATDQGKITEKTTLSLKIEVMNWQRVDMNWNL